MMLPLPLRLTAFYALLLTLALWCFGSVVYTQAEQRAYRDLDASLSSRAASVRMGKDLSHLEQGGAPVTLTSVDELGSGGVNIEILTTSLHLLASTSPGESYMQPTVTGLGTSPIPWDETAIHTLLQFPESKNGLFSTIIYKSQHIRVYTLINRDIFPEGHIIQTAHTTQDIEHAMSDLRALLWQGAMLTLLLALCGGWLLSWSSLAAVRRMRCTAEQISTSRDFSQRVHTMSAPRDELTMLANTFNQMLNSLEEAYQRQQRFVADASHELRAPVTSIRCNLDLLARAPDLPPDEVQGALDDARAEAGRMGRLVNDLLQLARADHQQQTGAIMRYTSLTDITIVDLDSLLLEVFRLYRPAETANATYQGPRLSLQQIVPVQVHGNADLLKQALVALVDNALKYTPHEGTVTLSLGLRGDRAYVQVSDTGIGIAPEDLPHIFERFYRADRVRTRDHGGSGLGLAIVQSIMQHNEGSIEVESTPGQGSTFTMLIPALPAQVSAQAD